MVEQTLAVFIVLALLAATLWLLRRKGLAAANIRFTARPKGTRQMEVVERIPLTPSHSLHLVRVQDRLILIGVSPATCALVHSLNSQSNYEGPVEGNR